MLGECAMRLGLRGQCGQKEELVAVCVCVQCGKKEELMATCWEWGGRVLLQRSGALGESDWERSAF